MLVSDEPARVLLAQDARALAVLLSIEFAVFYRLEHIFIRRASSRTGDMGGEVRDGAEKMHTTALLERGSILGEPFLDGVARFRLPVLHSAVVCRVQVEHGLFVFGFGESSRRLSLCHQRLF